MTISDVVFKNFWGVTSKKNDPKIATIVCSSPGVRTVLKSSPFLS